MGWSIGYDTNWDRDIGYGVPAICDHPECAEKIDRGLGYVCGKGVPYGGDDGCGLFFCVSHGGGHLCEKCTDGNDPDRDLFEPKPDVEEWTNHKMTDPSWAQWRAGRGLG